MSREAFEAAYAAIDPITPTKETAWLAWTASRAQALEEAAKVCDGLERRKWETIRDGGTLGGFGAKECAAAIRGASTEQGARDV